VKLLLDEMLSPDIAELLCGRGYDVQAIAASAHAALSDPEVLDLARSQQRAVVTNNVRDFRPMHIAAVQAGGAGHYGVVFMAGNFHRSKADIGRIAEALENKLKQYPGLDDLANGEDWL
jgi:predicted nuclease of predicted toxin-antitoxin system